MLGATPHTGRVADDQGLDEVARLLADNPGVGRVIGAKPSAGTSCDVVLLMLSPLDHGYGLRSAVVGLNRLAEVRDDLFAYPRPDTFAAEDVTFPKLEDALRSGGALAVASRADPVPDLTRWMGTEAFMKGLKRSRVRSQIPWLPQPPRWWHIMRLILIWAWKALFPLVFIAPYAAAFTWGQDPESMIFLGLDPEDVWWFVVFVFQIGIAVALLMFGEWAEGVADPRLTASRCRSTAPLPLENSPSRRLRGAS
jgi:hypothetical protein